MMTTLVRAKVLSWGLPGLLLAAAFLHNSLWWFFLPGLCLLFHQLVLAKGTRELLVGISVVILLKNLAALSWVLSTYPISWLGIESKFIEWVVIIFYWINMSIGLTIGSALALLLFALTIHRWPLITYTFPVVWVVAEVLGSVSFSIYSIGPGITPNIYFSFGYLGYLLAELAELAAVASFFGVYGLSFLSALVTLLVWQLYKFFTGKDRSYCLLILAVVLFGFVLICNYFYSPTKMSISQKVIAIDTTYDERYSRDKTAVRVKNLELRKAIEASFKYAPNLVLLPEDSRLTRSFESDDQVLSFLSSLDEEISPVVVDSSRLEIGSGDAIERAFYYDLKNQSVYHADKQYLVPQGEFLPYFTEVLLKLTAQKTLLEQFRANQNYVSGPINDYSSLPDYLPGILFCAESVSPLKIKQISSEHPHGLILYPSSHAWFHSPVTLHHQLDDMLRVQAIWNQVFIVEAGNMVDGKVYLPDGTSNVGEVLESADNWRLVLYNL